MSRRRIGLALLPAPLFALTFAAGGASAQNKPFPQSSGYAHGFVARNITTSEVLSSYDNWKSRYLKSDCGNGTYRVEFGSPQGSTVSEGIGYGMILTAYLGDRSAFDGLWKFAQKNMNKDGLMGWKVTCSGFFEREGGAGSATDGDTDIGLGLVAAIDQWGDSYKATAIPYLATLKKVDFTTCPASGRNLSKAGNWGGGCDFSNTSYFMPGFYRVFQELTGDPFWGKAADDAVALLLINRHPRTGLTSNEVDQDGATYSNRPVVNYNGCRTPWRVVLDYLWYGTAGAKDVTDRMTDWVNSVGIENLVDGYNTDGTPSPDGKYKQLNSWVEGRRAARCRRARMWSTNSRPTSRRSRTTTAGTTARRCGCWPADAQRQLLEARNAAHPRRCRSGTKPRPADIDELRMPSLCWEPRRVHDGARVARHRRPTQATAWCS